jgi:hypothetical protein
MIVTAFLFFGINLVILSLLVAGLTAVILQYSIRYDIMRVFIFLLMGKSIADYLLLLPVLKHYRKNRLIRYIIPAELIYFMYVSLVGIGGQILSFSWKGRRAPAGRFENAPDGNA